MKIWKLAAAVIMLSCFLVLSGCSRDINYIIGHEPSVRGVVTEITAGYITIDVNPDEDIYDSYSSIRVSLDVERKDSVTEFNVGDEVSVYYDGSISEAYSAQIDKVYAILYMGSAG